MCNDTSQHDFDLRRTSVLTMAKEGKDIRCRNHTEPPVSLPQSLRHLSSQCSKISLSYPKIEMVDTLPHPLTPPHHDG